MLGPLPFKEDTSPEVIFDHACQALRERGADYIGGANSAITPLLMRLDFQSIKLPDEDTITHPEDSSKVPETGKGESSSAPFIPFIETIQISYGIDYDCLPRNPAYGRDNLLRYSIELSFGIPISVGSVSPNEFSKAVGTFVLEYPDDFFGSFAEKGIDLDGHEVYETGNDYPEDSMAACMKLERGSEDDAAELREIRTIRFEVSERERTIRKTMSRLFEVGAMTTLLSSLTEIDGKICDEESSVAQHIQENNEYRDHDIELGNLFDQIMAECGGVEDSRDRVVFNYVSEILAMLAVSYDPYSVFVAET